MLARVVLLMVVTFLSVVSAAGEAAPGARLAGTEHQESAREASVVVFSVLVVVVAVANRTVVYILPAVFATEKLKLIQCRRQE